MYSDRRDQDTYPQRPEEVDADMALRGYRAIQLLLGLAVALFVVRLLAESL